MCRFIQINFINAISGEATNSMHKIYMVYLSTVPNVAEKLHTKGDQKSQQKSWAGEQWTGNTTTIPCKHTHNLATPTKIDWKLTLPGHCHSHKINTQLLPLGKVFRWVIQMPLQSPNGFYPTHPNLSKNWRYFGSRWLPQPRTYIASMGFNFGCRFWWITKVCTRIVDVQVESLLKHYETWTIRDYLHP